ncbi:hypothetical protein VC83_08156 [Pseudogymnoascus destructans]|uniref:Uncharacterized protein n=1 Tax=Pseudogymnoascus destructans TaxID=655981 RepID=A0A177A1U1_9PEZI|nr:uncharacterized protein VC83_08156 [Pseudogymnoascus destructans]OAF55241.1 hypothetical protein VC83_08156 [Pseudogymnoascus destructans]
MQHRDIFITTFRSLADYVLLHEERHAALPIPPRASLPNRPQQPPPDTPPHNPTPPPRAHLHQHHPPRRQKSLPQTPPPKAIPQTPRRPPPTQTYQSYTAKLASRSAPTPLYIAPSHTFYILAAYTGATFCIAYAGFSYYANVYAPPSGLSAWVPIAFAGICFLMAGMGGWLLFAPTSLIRSITAYPVKSLVANGQPTLRIDIELRRVLPIPFLAPRVVSASPADLLLNHSIYVPPTRPATASERFELARLQAEEREAERKKSVMLAPFRHASHAAFGLFVAIKRTWTRDGFLDLKAGKRRYKLDITGGWALDEGRALDRICKVMPS